VINAIVWLLLLRTAFWPQPAAAQEAPPAAGATAAASEGPLPMRLEIGGYGSWMDNGYGSWRGVAAQFSARFGEKLVPIFTIDSQTRSGHAQQNYAFLSYVTWSDSFYTVQGFSAATARSPAFTYFPDRRFDVKAYWKIPPRRHVVIGGGFSRFDFGSQARGDVFNVGALYYRNRFVLEGNAFVNRNQPGDLVSHSGIVSAQYGIEGRYWIGLSASAGRELYQYVAVVPLEVRLSNHSTGVFYRQWLSRKAGVAFNVDYQNRREAYRRAGVSTSLFFDF
jgi:YaiO family outer membrane protein